MSPVSQSINYSNIFASIFEYLKNKLNMHKMLDIQKYQIKFDTLIFFGEF